MSADRRQPGATALRTTAVAVACAGIYFVHLPVAYAIVVLVPRLRKKDLPPVAHVLVRGAFGLLYLGGILLIAWTGHRGGVLVHVLGVRALIPQ